MTVPEAYRYLVQARSDLWAALEGVPDEILSRPLLNGDRFHCVKDLIFHIADVEDGWINGDILQGEMVQKSIPVLWNMQSGPVFADVALQMLLDYWRAVEQSTQAYLARLDENELKRIVVIDDSPEKRLAVDGLLWHVIMHEIRHTAQICVLLRTQGIKPPSLDLLFYLPVN